MNSIIKEIGKFIFVENIPEKPDAIMVVGGSHPELGGKSKICFYNKFILYPLFYLQYSNSKPDVKLVLRSQG